MAHQHLGKLLAQLERGVERHGRVLEDHGDAPAADRVHLGLAVLAQIVAGEIDDAAALDGVGRQGAHDRPGERRLARAGFADQAHDLAGCDRQVDGVERAEGTVGTA